MLDNEDMDRDEILRQYNRLMSKEGHLVAKMATSLQHNDHSQEGRHWRGQNQPEVVWESGPKRIKDMI